MALDIYTPQGFFGSCFPQFRIGNMYARPVNPPHCLVSTETALISCNSSYLVAGYFNIDNPAVDPFRVRSSNDERESAPTPPSLRPRPRWEDTD